MPQVPLIARCITTSNCIKADGPKPKISIQTVTFKSNTSIRILRDLLLSQSKIYFLQDYKSTHNQSFIMVKIAISTVLAVVIALTNVVDSQQPQPTQVKNLIDVYAESVFNYAVLNNRKPVVVYFGNE